MDFVDSKYIGLISSRLQKFKQVKPDLFNFRCPICGDSQRNKNRARGYLYSIKSNTNFKCHNCGMSLSFNNFLKDFDSVLYKQYTLEKFKSKHVSKPSVIKEPKFTFKKPVFKKKLDLPKASENDRARTYLENRGLNPNKFFYAENFKKWTNTHKKTFDNIKYDEPRIIIPLYDFDNSLIGFQGRALKSNSVKYITVMLNEDSPKIYGLNRIQSNQTVYVTEGPFDSEFISNSIAMCGADANLDQFSFNDVVWIYDNEPRNIEIVSRIEKTINRGEKVVIWSSSNSYKDINLMAMSGLNVMDMVKSRTYSGLEAKIKFNSWKKV